MNLKVDQDACIGCGMCIDICPEIFKYNSDGKSESTAETVLPEFEEKVKESAEVCPTEAIITE